MTKDSNYYTGLSEGLNEGVAVLRTLIEEGNTIDDMLSGYNHLVTLTNVAFTQNLETEGVL